MSEFARVALAIIVTAAVGASTFAIIRYVAHFYG